MQGGTRSTLKLDGPLCRSGQPPIVGDCPPRHSPAIGIDAHGDRGRKAELRAELEEGRLKFHGATVSMAQSNLDKQRVLTRYSRISLLSRVSAAAACVYEYPVVHYAFAAGSRVVSVQATRCVYGQVAPGFGKASRRCR